MAVLIRFLPILALTATTVNAAFTQQPRDHVVRVFKRVGGDSLVMHVHTPANTSVPRPAVLLFHGGAFVWGGPEISDASARQYAELGLVAFSVQYRLVNRSTITPIEQLEDAFDAIRWVRAHAVEFGIDPARIIDADPLQNPHFPLLSPRLGASARTTGVRLGRFEIGV